MVGSLPGHWSVGYGLKQDSLVKPTGLASMERIVKHLVQIA